MDTHRGKILDRCQESVGGLVKQKVTPTYVLMDDNAVWQDAPEMFGKSGLARASCTAMLSY